MDSRILDRMKLQAKNELEEDVLYSWEVRNLVNNVRVRGGSSALKSLRQYAKSAGELGIEDTVTVGNKILFYPVSCVERYLEERGFHLSGELGELIQNGYTTRNPSQLM
jgi:hypothetical protein